MEILESKNLKILNIFNQITNKIINSYRNKVKLVINTINKLKKYDKKYVLKNGFALIEKDGVMITKSTKIGKDDILTINIFDKKIIVKVVDSIN